MDCSYSLGRAQNFSVRTVTALVGIPRESWITIAEYSYSAYPPAQNQYMQEINLGKLIFVRINVGPVFALARKPENYFEGLFPTYLPNSWGNSFMREYMRGLYSTRANTGTKSWQIVCALVSFQGVIPIEAVLTIIVTELGPCCISLEIMSLPMVLLWCRAQHKRSHLAPP